MNQSAANALLSPSSQLLESLSALMDGEADTLEMRRVVKGLPETPELADRWRRYHAVRASLRQETHVDPAIDLLPGIKARLLAEQGTVGRPSRGFGDRFLRLAGQGAIAASVAAAVLLAYPLLQGSDPAGEAGALVADQNAATTPEVPALNSEYTASPLTRTVNLDEASRDRLQQAVYEFSGTPAVLNSSSPMFPNQLAPLEQEVPQDQ